ncbi:MULTISPECIES: FtsX-like permease family protein [unclassified Actinomyces]|uniref:ABC transporter permease n=1 Tax=unclassified Actinomyces TaxID=2609248 RepID=UPI002016CC86|nr:MULTISPECIES: FtsX-like permease family protein [unclassified Actinomyces]MCL3776695.1 FtsX-like permease family protein [Actinomyces sp. AC-20-1]MCL3790618.1 FtsX-like permease family protein [Actinomyces sp. 187325]MCL3792941.1 FtsX-like permease family protein [Actinomyces sp. 186855]MCL3795354.1 FtsX-like permease family protein [Actinomyces sp. 217892]
MTNRRMFLTMLLGALLRRRGRAAAAIGSSAVGAATLFCLAAVCLAVPAQMSEEMRQYGANVILVPVAGATAGEGTARLDETAVRAAQDVLGSVAGASAGAGDLRSAAYRYETVRVNKSAYLMGGIDVEATRSLNGHWEVDGAWPGQGEVLIGADVAGSTGLGIGDMVNVEYLSTDNLTLGSVVSSDGASQTQGERRWRVVGTVDTGGSEDDIIYVPLAALEDLTAAADAGYDVVEMSVDTSTVPAAQAVQDLNAAGLTAQDGTGLRAQEVSKITSGNTRIIAMLNTLFWVVAVVVLALTLVGVSTTMTVIVSERRKEIGLRKALGASAASIGAEFYTEAAVMGLVGGLLGTAVGHGLAWAVGVGVFERPIAFSWWLALCSLALSAAVAVVAASSPVRRATRIDPAVVLREE